MPLLTLLINVPLQRNSTRNVYSTLWHSQGSRKSCIKYCWKQFSRSDGWLDRHLFFEWESCLPCSGCCRWSAQALKLLLHLNKDCEPRNATPTDYSHTQTTPNCLRENGLKHWSCTPNSQDQSFSHSLHSEFLKFSRG